MTADESNRIEKIALDLHILANVIVLIEQGYEDEQPYMYPSNEAIYDSFLHIQQQIEAAEEALNQLCTCKE